MTPMTMGYLESCFNRAKELGKNFVAIRIEMEGFPEPEIIVNPIINADSKLAYYKKTYDEELNHKYAKGIRISGFSFADDIANIEVDFRNTDYVDKIHRTISNINKELMQTKMENKSPKYLIVSKPIRNALIASYKRIENHSTQQEKEIAFGLELIELDREDIFYLIG
ncbi:hypothetical protein [Virgibacillus sp. CBA3643]|uniref:hypothetical protein n=1 Tax=Virgibacillus sp. CBA3643 TaxID=2942278 RepID=UPI0035A37CFA